MVKVIPKNPAPDDDFSHRYAGGINQYGTKGAESPDTFQNYMNDGMTQGISPSNSPSPMDIMSSPTDSSFGPPPTPIGDSMQSAAPENFGPPQIQDSGQAESSNFGAPGSQDPNGANSANFGPPGYDNGNPNNATQVGLNPSNGQISTGNVSANQSNGNNNPVKAHLDPNYVKHKTYTEKEVMDLMTKNMLNNAIRIGTKKTDLHPDAFSQ